MSKPIRLAAAALLVIAACDSDSATSTSDTGADAATSTDTTTPSDTPTAPGDVPVDDATPTPDVLVADTASPDVSAGSDTVTIDPGAEGLPVSGTWRAAVDIAEIPGVVVSFLLEATVVDNGDGTGVFSSLVLRPSAEDGSDPGEVMGTMSDVPIAADGSFEIDWPAMTWPSSHSLTGTPIVIDITMIGRVVGSKLMCGQVAGFVPALGLFLVDSTFGAIPADEAAATPKSCEDTGGPETFERYEAAECPPLADGVNTWSQAAGVQRTLVIHTPPNLDTSAPTPLLFWFHGLGGGPGGVNGTGLFAQADARGWIVISPGSQALAATEWEQVSTADNADQAMVDDLVTCANAQWNVDLDRVHVSGMSGGGLYASYLAVVRPDLFASAAPSSGGLLIPYPDPAQTIPVMAIWGGEADVAVGQNFHTFATNMIADLRGGQHFVVACDHGLGHDWDTTLAPALLDFLAAHPRGAPPWTALPAGFPSACTIAP